MKKLLFISMLLFSISSFAQDPWNPARAYWEIVGTGNLTGIKVKIEIDFGQAKHFGTGSTDKFLVDKSGKENKFNSIVDALN